MLKGSLWLALLLVALLGLMSAKNLLEQPPRLRAQSSSEQFDAVRAKSRLARILGDEKPHPVDSAANDEVRSRLIGALDQQGLRPLVRDQFTCNELFKQRGVSCAHVRNVLAEFGPAGSKAVLLNAHYDSVPAGPGASDDGMGVATLLEVAEILKHHRLKRPVILLFNEGEELGLIGARAFLNDPLSLDVGSLINLEARGENGPVNMFETSRPNATPILLFGAAVKNPVGNSLSTDVYRLMPNYTDVNSFSERAWLTFNLAPIGNETRYHSAGDDLNALNTATLQHMGDQTLALTERLANSPGATTDGERIFMDVAGRGLINLPLTLGLSLLLALLVIFLHLAVSRGALPRALVVLAGTVAGSGLMTWIALQLIGAFRGGMFWRAEPQWTFLAAYASSILLGSSLLGTVAKKISRHQLRTSFWLFVLALGCLAGTIAPGAIIFFLFPPLIAAIGMLVSRRWNAAEDLASLAAILFLYVTWGGFLGLFEELLDNGPMWIFAPFGALLILPVLIEAKPLIMRAGPASATAIGTGATILAWIAAAAAPAYSADRQQRFVIEHVTDASRTKSWWSVLNDGAPLPKAFPGTWTLGKLPFSDRPRWLTNAPPVADTMAPDVQIISQVQSGSERTLQLRLRANGYEGLDLIAPGDAKIRSAGTMGFARPIDQNEPGKCSIRCFGRSCDGAIVQMTIGEPKPVEFTIVGSRSPLPASAAPLLAARPKFARPQYNRNESITFITRRI